MTGTQSHGPNVVVVGSYAVGLVMRTARIPVRGETVLGQDFQAMDGGKGSNQAIACTRLGAHTTFLAAIGDDSYGHAAVALFRKEGLDTSFVHRMPDVPTGTGFILVDPQGDNAIAVDLGANRLLHPDHIDQAEQAIAEADVVLAQLEIPRETALHAMAVAKRHGVRAVLNPAPAQPLPDGALAAVDILTPNVTEAQVLTGLTTSDPQALVEALRRAGAGTVILTVGEQGAWIGDDQGLRQIPAVKVDAVDTTGAGDAFSAALAVALAQGTALDDAVRYGCAAGSYSVCSAGTVPSYPTRAELAAFLQLHGSMAPA
ncbi:MAG: ribokinase [Chloroflexi bacterium]|nr:ribokinase [Chloroflexota bacterium]